jgi:hypothetical protein
MSKLRERFEEELRLRGYSEVTNRIYILAVLMVVFTLRYLAARSSCKIRMSYPASRRWVAKESRRGWQVACLAMPAFLAASWNARWIPHSCIWTCNQVPGEGTLRHFESSSCCRPPGLEGDHGSGFLGLTP